jgi:hypothetical protein
MTKRLTLIALAGLSLSGCYSFNGPRPLYASRGVVAKDNHGYRSGPMFVRFEEAAAVAAGCRPASAPGASAMCDPGRMASQPELQEFMRSGYALIYADCSDYFAEMGHNESRSRVTRAAVGPITTVLTGLITLYTFKKSETQKNVLSLLSIGSNAFASGLDIYDQDFLFGANNISAVRQLITTALTTHAQATLQNQDLTFEQASIDLLDNEQICTPSQIMMLTRQAIASGNVQPITSIQPQPAAAPPAPPAPPPAAPAEQPTLKSTSVSAQPH